MALRIYSYPQNYRVQKAQIAAAFAGIDIETPAFEFGKDNKTEEFKATKHPLGKVPVLETPHGAIFESFAILRYVARLRPEAGLYGKDFWSQAKVDQWLDFCSNEFEAPRNIWYYPVLGIMQFDERAYQGAKRDTLAAMKVFDNHLLNNTFFVGNSITIADISIACALVGAYTTLFDPKVVAEFPNVLRWFNTMVNQPEVAKFVGVVNFADKEKQAERKQKADKKDQKDQKEKPAPKDNKKPKDAPKEGKEKPAPAAAAAAGEKAAKSNADLLDELEKPQKKEKNPLDLLPPSNMVLDAVKKHFFSVKPFAPDFWATFWPQFDAAGYSLYFCDYKYNDDNKVYFMTCNLIGGFVQRAEESRKYAFGALNLYGVNDEIPPFKINGAWIFRGVGIPKEMQECPDSDGYNWTKVDPADAAQRTKFEKRFTAEVDVGQGDEKLFERKYFK